MGPLGMLDLGPSRTLRRPPCRVGPSLETLLPPLLHRTHL